MPDSYSCIILHFTFSVKDRYRLISKEIQEDLNRYIAGIIKNIDCIPLIVNGVEDHVHVLSILSRKRSTSEFARIVKTNSSKWLSEKHKAKFEWQKGYACFSVSKSNVESVKRYIENQQEHHRKRTFKEEYDRFIELHQDLIL